MEASIRLENEVLLCPAGPRDIIQCIYGRFSNFSLDMLKEMLHKFSRCHQRRTFSNRMGA